MKLSLGRKGQNIKKCLHLVYEWPQIKAQSKNIGPLNTLENFATKS